MKKFAITVLSFWLIAVMLGRLLGLNPNSIDLNAILSTPSAACWLGADDLVFWRDCCGALKFLLWWPLW